MLVCARRAAHELNKYSSVALAFTSFNIKKFKKVGGEEQRIFKSHINSMEIKSSLRISSLKEYVLGNYLLWQRQ